MTDAPAPRPALRLIPSRFPPIGLFDTVATAADLEAVMELVGWTNDRLLVERIARLPRADWVYGRANASIVMAAFLHVAPGGTRFNGPDLGAWYASATVRTAAVEVAHHLRREAAATAQAEMRREYRCYAARLDGAYRDLRGQATAYPGIYASDSYAVSQAFGEALRLSGGDGILYDSVRHAGGANVVAYRPRKVREVAQAEHMEITVRAAERRIGLRTLGERE